MVYVGNSKIANLEKTSSLSWPYLESNDKLTRFHWSIKPERWRQFIHISRNVFQSGGDGKDLTQATNLNKKTYKILININNNLKCLKRGHKPDFVENSKNAFAKLVTNVLFDRRGWKQGIIDGQQESWKKVIVSYIIIFTWLDGLRLFIS